MSDVAHELLLKLLRQVDRGGREMVPISEISAKSYFSVSELSHRDSIHAALRNAQAEGAISLEWGKGAASQDLKRIRLRDAELLAEWLGVPRASNYATLIENELLGIANHFPAWLRSAYDDALQEWRKGQSTLRISAVDTDTAIKLFRVAYAVSRSEQAGLDLRRFSVRLLGDSKAVENLLSKLAPLLRRNPEWEQFEDNYDLCRYLGLEKFAPPILIKGPLCLKYSGEEWDCSSLRPYVGVSPDLVSEIKATAKVPYLLTIENLASFQRHVREISDNAVVIYTAGFPSPSLLQILQSLDRVLASECHFYHWGDRDVGGIRIFSYLENGYTFHQLRPHLMALNDSKCKPFTDSEQRAIKSYISDESMTSKLAAIWMDECPCSLEQEAVDPSPP